MRILITGASRGIGRAAALQLVRSRQHRVLALGRTASALADLQRSVVQEVGEGPLSYLAYDLNAPDTGPLEAALRTLGGIDILINNAGLLIKKPFSSLEPEDWRQVFDTNFFAVVRLIHLALPFFPDEGGHIVNIGSMGGFPGSAKYPGMIAYSAAKAALANLTEGLAEELGDRGIAVNCLSLGAVQTEMLEKAFPGYQAPVSGDQMGSFLAWFVVNGHYFFNGKVLPVSRSTP